MQGWQVIEAYVDRAGVRHGVASLGQTIGGTHADGSKHYLGLARDYGLADSDADAISRLFAPLAQGVNAPITELFGSDGASFSHGQRFAPEPAGHAGDHTHVAVAAGATVDDLIAGRPVFNANAGIGVTDSGTVDITTADTTLLGRVAGLGRTGTWIRVGEVILGGAGLVVGALLLSKDLKGTAGSIAAAVGKGS